MVENSEVNTDYRSVSTWKQFSQPLDLCSITEVWTIVLKQNFHGPQKQNWQELSRPYPLWATSVSVKENMSTTPSVMFSCHIFSSRYLFHLVLLGAIPVCAQVVFLALYLGKNVMSQASFMHSMCSSPFSSLPCPLPGFNYLSVVLEERTMSNEYIAWDNLSNLQITSVI